MGLEELNTVLTMMRELNPLTLGCKSELSQLSLDCLDNVTHFIKECLNSDFIKNMNGEIIFYYTIITFNF